MADSDFGFELAPDISEAERAAVSTDPDSALQRAIRSTQQAEGFRTPAQLLTMGPRSFDIAAKAEKERRDMLTDRARQGIALTGQAISQRGAQRKTDTRRFQEDQAKAFFERTKGMDEDEAWASMTNAEAANEIIPRRMDALDAARIGRGESKERLFAQKVGEATRDFDTEVEIAKKQKTLQLLTVGGAIDNIVKGDVRNPYTREQLVADTDIVDPAVSAGLSAALASAPEETKAQLSFVKDGMDLAAKANAYGIDTRVLEDVSGNGLRAIAGRDFNPERVGEVARAKRAITKAIQAKEAEKAALELEAERVRVAARRAAINPTKENAEKAIKAQMEKVKTLQDLSTEKGAHNQTLVVQSMKDRAKKERDLLELMMTQKEGVNFWRDMVDQLRLAEEIGRTTPEEEDEDPLPETTPETPAETAPKKVEVAKKAAVSNNRFDQGEAIVFPGLPAAAE
jgi:hypothetical protein